ncbi:MAG: hypothetical protein J0M16_05430 [Gammaproteobacteria bacterium]|nr:hypothetical protein [Gammaproteobacteria bacterium]
MKTKGMGIALLSAAALLGTTAARAELPWTYAELAYLSADGTDNFETDALELKASVGFADMWHAQLGYTDGETDGNFTAGDDFDGYRFVVGINPQLTPNTQMLVDLGYQDYEFDGGEGSDAILVGFGLRHALTDKVEIMSEIWYADGSTDQGDVDYHDTSLNIGGRYNWMPNLSTGLSLDIGGGSGYGTSSSDVVRFDIRWSFLGGLSK